MKKKELLKIEQKQVEFSEVIKLYKKSKPLTRKLSTEGIKHFAKINRLKFTPDSFVEWLGTCKLVANNKKGVQNG